MEGLADDVAIEDLVVKSTVRNLEIPVVDVPTFLRNSWKKAPGATAIIDAANGDRITCNQLEETTERIAAGFQDLGVKPGDTVAFVSSNSVDLVMALVATTLAGATIACAKATFNEREIEAVLNLTKPSLVFCDMNSAEKARKACQDVASVKVLVATGDCDGMVNFAKLKTTPRGRFTTPPCVGPDSIFTVFQSSGSTGLPKGSLITHRNFVAELVAFTYKNRSVRDSRVFLLYLPVMHAAPFWLLFMMLAQQVELVLPSPGDLNSVLHLIEKYQVDNMFIYPTHALQIVQRGLPPVIDISSVRYVLIAGSSIPQQAMRAFAQLFNGCKIIHGYGLTETCLAVTYTRDTCHDFKTIGTPIPYVNIKIVDIDTGKKLGPGEHGEVCVKGPTCFKSYLGMPEATTTAFDEEGFFKTGDTGYYNASGQLYVLDRMKDLIKCNDQQVAPAELEELLHGHPDVTQAAVVGVPHPEFGEAARAFLVLNEAVRPSTEAATEKKRREFEEFVKNLVAVHKQLHGGVQFVDMIPQTETGKPCRRKLKEAYAQNESSVLS
ncbi:uncharacterized protein LOC144158570 isoform X2 [Haemaphysalis longicornis]